MGTSRKVIKADSTQNSRKQIEHRGTLFLIWTCHAEGAFARGIENLAVVDPEGVGDCRVDVKDGYGVFRDLAAVFIRASVDESALDPATGHEVAEGSWVVTSAIVIVCLNVWRAAKLGSEHDEGGVE